MKLFRKVALVALIICGMTMSAQTKKVNVEKSSIEWIGKKVVGSHNGKINFNSGHLEFKGDDIISGSFEVNMNSITVTDLEAGKGKERLEGHLKNDDFFSTDKFPTATLEISNAKKKSTGVYDVTGNLTIKGVTKPIQFTLNVSKSGASSKLLVDRTLYDIKYRSGNFFEGLGDRAILDEFELNTTIVF